MKIKVQHDDGRIETVTIKGCVEVREGKALRSDPHRGWDGTLKTVT